MTFHILHYEEDGDGDGEYIVITEEDITQDLIDENLLPGYKFSKSYECEGNLGTLPTDFILRR